MLCEVNFVCDAVQQADVLVNPIASKPLDFKNAGAVASHFCQVAGPELQKACV